MVMDETVSRQALTRPFCAGYDYFCLAICWVIYFYSIFSFQHINHPFIHLLYPALLHSGSLGYWSLSQSSQGESWATPWMSRQFIWGRHNEKQLFALVLALTPTANVEFPVLLVCMFVDCGRNHTERTCRLHTDGAQALGMKPVIFMLWGDSANNRTTLLPSYQSITFASVGFTIWAGTKSSSLRPLSQVRKKLYLQWNYLETDDC